MDPPMPDPYGIRRLGAAEWPVYRAVRLRSLEDAPHAFGSSLAAEQHRPAALWQARLIAAREDRDCPLVAMQGGSVVGMVWGKSDNVDPHLVHVYQMWVAPEARGCGVGATLLAHVIDWSRANGAHTVRLAVSLGNEPAAALYRRAGFREVGVPAALHSQSAMLSQMMEMALADRRGTLRCAP